MNEEHRIVKATFLYIILFCVEVNHSKITKHPFFPAFTQGAKLQKKSPIIGSLLYIPLKLRGGLKIAFIVSAIEATAYALAIGKHFVLNYIGITEELMLRFGITLG